MDITKQRRERFRDLWNQIGDEMFNIIANIVQQKAGQAASKTYTAIPTPPSFGTTTTLVYATTGNTIESGETGGNTDLLVDTTFADRMRPNGLVGTSGTPYRFKSLSDSVYSVIGGDAVTAATQVITTLNSSNYCYFYHIKLIGNSTESADGITGFNWNPVSGSNAIVLSDAIIDNVGFAGVQFQASSNTYDSINLNFVRVFGWPIEGECYYLGKTDKTTYAVITSLVMDNCLGTNKGRDGIQINNCLDIQVSNCTIYDVGKANTAGQRALTQVQNSFGLVENCIFDGSPNLCDIASHGITFRNCYFRWDNSSGFIGDLLAQYASPIGTTNTPSPTGTPGSGTILFDNCVFDPVNTMTNMLQVNDADVHVEVRDSIISTNITNLYLDNRGTSSYDLIGTPTTNGNTQIAPASIPKPSYTNFDVDASDHGLVTDDYWYNRGAGYRTPPPA